MSNKRLSFIALSGLAIASLLLQGCVPGVLLGASATTAGVNAAGSNLPAQTQVYDSAIHAQALHVLNQFPMLAHDGSNVEVTVFDQIVLLVGQVPTADLRTQIAAQIAAIPKVLVVYNQLTVGPALSLASYADDSLITSRVKANMLGHVNPLHFKVVTEKGVVYLLAVTTQQEGEEAARIASYTDGVREVVKAYSYIIS